MPLVENAGVKLRLLETKDIEPFPSNGFIALEETLQAKRQEAVAVAQGYAKGTAFAIANPEAAIKILWEVFPQTKPTGKDEATALKDDVKVLMARAQSWKLESVGAKQWGENRVENYAAYADFMLKYGIIKEKVAAADLVPGLLERHRVGLGHVRLQSRERAEQATGNANVGRL